MITKTEAFKATDGTLHHNIESAKNHEFLRLIADIFPPDPEWTPQNQTTGGIKIRDIAAKRVKLAEILAKVEAAVDGGPATVISGGTGFVPLAVAEAGND